MGLKYEFYQDASLLGFERLWLEATEWGKIKSGHAPLMLNAPFGKPRVIIATDTDSGEDVGQFHFLPLHVMVDGKVIRAVRPFGTIVTPAMHAAAVINNPLDQPAVAMYTRAVAELKAMGEQLVYMVPDPRWIRLFKMFPFLQAGTFPLWSLPVPIEKPVELDKAYTVAPLKEGDERVDRLWEKSSRLHGCMVLRNGSTLQWKLSNAGYTTTAVEKDGELVGLVASRQKGDRQWLVCDMLCADAGDSMRATLTAASSVAHEKSLTGVGKEAIHKVAVLATPLMEPILRDLGFVRDAYDFPLIVHVLDENIAAEDVNPSRWYVCATD